MKEYKYSQWNVTYSLNEEKIMLLNTLTSAGMIIKKSELKKIQNGDFYFIEENLLNNLIENGFIVLKDQNESACFWRLYHTLKYRSISECLHLVLMPTYKCNFQCRYCFENFDALKNKKEDVINSNFLLSWIQNFWNIYKFKILKVIFYGGEPLMYKERLKEYIEIFKKWSTKKEIEFSFSIVTNGSLLDKNILQYMIESGLSEVQITIDGIKEIHDVRRPFKNGKGSFDVVYNNLLQIINLPIKVIIRSNLDKHNISEFKFFINMLKKEGIFSKKNVIFTPAFVDPSTSKSWWCKKFVPHTLKERVKILKNVWLDLLEEIETPEILLQSHKLLFSLCNAKVADCFIIGPDGTLYTCYSLVGDKEGEVGNI
jgi:uncharacterized protein